MKSFSLKKSMLMLVALFMLGACSTQKSDVTPDDYNTEFIKLIKEFDTVDGYKVGSSGKVLERYDGCLFHFKNATSDTSAMYCRHRGEVGLVYTMTVSYNQSSWSAGTETSNLTEELFLNIVGGYGSFHHTVKAGDYKFLEDGKTLYYYSDNNPDYEPHAVTFNFSSVEFSNTYTATATYKGTGSLYVEVVVKADEASKADAIVATLKTL